MQHSIVSKAYFSKTAHGNAEWQIESVIKKKKKKKKKKKITNMRLDRIGYSTLKL